MLTTEAEESTTARRKKRKQGFRSIRTTAADKDARGGGGTATNTTTEIVRRTARGEDITRADAFAAPGAASYSNRKRAKKLRRRANARQLQDALNIAMDGGGVKSIKDT